MKETGSAGTIEPEIFEARVVARLAFSLLGGEPERGTLALRQATHSTSRLPGLAFESIRLNGAAPDTALEVYFRDVSRCQYLFGFRLPLWALLDEWTATRGRRIPWREDPEVFAEAIYVEIAEDIDMDQPELPPSEECQTDSVNWVLYPAADDRMRQPDPAAWSHNPRRLPPEFYRMEYWNRMNEDK